MDEVVAARGVPLSVEESFFGGLYPSYRLMLAYRTDYYIFQTDAEKSYTKLIANRTMSSALGPSQKPFPAWFKARYPNLP